MKSVKVLIAVILLLSISSFGIIQTADAQEEEILTPNLTVSGTISLTHLSDYYRIEISQPGVYTLELNSTGSPLIEASFNRFSYGYPSVIRSCYSNSSDCFTILPSSQYYGSFYQLEVSYFESSLDNISEYSVSIKKVETKTIEEGREYIIYQDRYTDSHYTLNISDYNCAYRIIASSSISFTFLFYNSNGIQIADLYCNLYHSINHIVLLDKGTCHLFLHTNNFNEDDVTFQITREELPILTLENSIQVDFEGSSLSVYVRLPLAEGTKYSIQLGPHSLQNVGFDILFNSYSGVSIDYWGGGTSESIDDFVFWDNCMAYTGWDNDPEMQMTRSRPVIYRSYPPPYKLQNSHLLLRAFSDIEGSATLRLTRVQEPQTLSPDFPVSEQFDGIHGPFWKLYKMDTLGGELYNFHFTHTPATDCILNPTYVLYRPLITDQIYLSRTRPLLSEIEKNIWDNLPGVSTTFSYDESLPNSYAYYYHPILCESWLYVSIPDAFYNGQYHNTVHSGSMSLAIQQVEPIITTISSEITTEPSLDTSIYSIQLEGNCIYKIAVTGSNYQSYGQISLWNVTGHQLQSSYSITAQTDKNTRYYEFDVVSTGEYHLLVNAFGDLPLTITITKMTDSSSSDGIQVPFFIGGLIAAAAEGILIGIVIGKIKFGKEVSG